ncbi:MAG: transglycosylase SLT domain-containing protein, partial [Spirochaetota bacterium]
MGLTLYRNNRYKNVVIDFFTNLTGSKKISRSILMYADHYDIPISLAFSLSWVESRFYPYAVSRNQNSVDRGLFQLNSR